MVPPVIYALRPKKELSMEHAIRRSTARQQCTPMDEINACLTLRMKQRFMSKSVE